ncbi:hypothetical protein QN277_006344 [Acacia crassicarpa]|uniref:Uncharacterized protein n=1 Tax=Acacia crassicarpa TaxID=499986 RepID=A0AAE1M8K6_9FABA|nr:hypothetical protein QN277_006344 [Acacia crassicarpa]
MGGRSDLISLVRILLPLSTGTHSVFFSLLKASNSGGYGEDWRSPPATSHNGGGSEYFLVLYSSFIIYALLGSYSSFTIYALLGSCSFLRFNFEFGFQNLC